MKRFGSLDAKRNNVNNVYIHKCIVKVIFRRVNNDPNILIRNEFSKKIFLTSR